MRHVAIGTGAVALVAGARVARAQGLAFAPEVRVDAVAARRSSLELGGGLFARASTNVRLGLAGGIDPGIVSGHARRVEAVARFHLDPYRERRWGLYGATGISVRWRDGDRGRPFLLAVVGLDGPPRHGVAPALEAGLGGGARLGLSLRRARAGAR